jgi:hypothetical protein
MPFRPEDALTTHYASPVEVAAALASDVQHSGYRLCCVTPGVWYTISGEHAVRHGSCMQPV